MESAERRAPAAPEVARSHEAKKPRGLGQWFGLVILGTTAGLYAAIGYGIITLFGAIG